MMREGKESVRSSSSSSSSPSPSSSVPASASSYSLKPVQLYNEDILFCIDTDLESQTEMKIPGPNGRLYTRLDSIKQAILLFINSKLYINPHHRFGFAALGKSASLLRKELSNEVDFAISVLRPLTATAAYGKADLTQLFRIAASEAEKSRTQNRIFRVILIYCRSSVLPRYQSLPDKKTFTLDVIYLHDKPNPENCPQKVYDSLVDALESVTAYEGYIFESGQGLLRVLLRQMCSLLAHPQQRCEQEAIDFPKSLAIKSPAPETTPSEDSTPVPIQ